MEIPHALPYTTSAPARSDKPANLPPSNNNPSASSCHCQKSCRIRQQHIYYLVHHLILITFWCIPREICSYRMWNCENTSLPPHCRPGSGPPPGRQGRRPGGPEHGAACWGTLSGAPPTDSLYSIQPQHTLRAAVHAGYSSVISAAAPKRTAHPQRIFCRCHTGRAPIDSAILLTGSRTSCWWAKVKQTSAGSRRSNAPEGYFTGLVAGDEGLCGARGQRSNAVVVAEQGVGWRRVQRAQPPAPHQLQHTTDHQHHKLQVLLKVILVGSDR